MRPRLRWYAAGDVNAFFGLALDNLTQLVILSSLLIGLFKFPADLVLFRMIPGTALGVLVGDLTYTWLAVRRGAPLAPGGPRRMIERRLPSLTGVAAPPIVAPTPGPREGHP